MKRKIVLLFRKILKPLIQRIVILNYKGYCQTEPRKRALLSFIVHPIIPPIKYREKKFFSNYGICIQIVKGLNELGYIVDIVDGTNTKWTPKKRYDLFIGHGGTNYRYIVNKLNKDAYKIYFSTGPYWKTLNTNEAKRIYDVAVRTGFLFPPDRAIYDDEEFANKNADGIICLGNKDIVKTFANFKNVININNGHFKIKDINTNNKDYVNGRKHFLFFSGKGNIHKGLDLLLEAFMGTDLHLHICQSIEPIFGKIYDDALYKCPNIHNEGFIKMRSKKFIELIKICDFVILPTCAEGQPGSLIECMAYGLIPITTKYSNISIEEYGLYIQDLQVNAIKSIIITASKLDPEIIRNKSNNLIKYMYASYSEDDFLKSIKDSIKKMIYN